MLKQCVLFARRITTRIALHHLPVLAVAAPDAQAVRSVRQSVGLATHGRRRTTTKHDSLEQAEGEHCHFACFGPLHDRFRLMQGWLLWNKAPQDHKDLRVGLFLMFLRAGPEVT